MDLLKACQRDGLVRIERDRRGGLRVFQGPNMARPAEQPQDQASRIPEGDDGQPITPDSELADDVQPMMVEVTDQTEPDVIEIEPVSVVDTTAELLGRAKPRAPRARAGRTERRRGSVDPLNAFAIWRQQRRCRRQLAQAGGKEGGGQAPRPAFAQADQQERRRLRQSITSHLTI